MSYFDSFDGPRYANYARDREKQEEFEWWIDRRSIMNCERGPIVTRLCGADETILPLGGDSYIHVPKDIGDRANALRAMGAKFGRTMRCVPGRPYDSAGVVSCMLPDGTRLTCDYGREMGYVIGVLEELVSLAENATGGGR